MINLQNIRIVGGVHTNKRYLTQIKEETLEEMTNALSEIIARYIKTDAYVTVEYKKSYGVKINS